MLPKPNSSRNVPSGETKNHTAQNRTDIAALLYTSRRVRTVHQNHESQNHLPQRCYLPSTVTPLPTEMLICVSSTYHHASLYASSSKLWILFPKRQQNGATVYSAAALLSGPTTADPNWWVFNRFDSFFMEHETVYVTAVYYRNFTLSWFKNLKS